MQPVQHTTICTTKERRSHAPNALVVEWYTRWFEKPVPKGLRVRVSLDAPEQPQHEAAYNRDALAFYVLGENVERKGRVETYSVRAP